MRLAVDLGTSHTVAVVRRDGQPVRALLFDGSPMLPSGVFIDPAGELLTGKDAERLARTAPDRFEPHPKRGVDEGFALLGQTEVAVPDLLAAILRRVSVEARHAGVDPAGGLILTCPADWGKPRRDVLREAARRAGLHDVRLVEEPVAAATYCLDVSGQQVSVGQVLAVFDFGGGTLDVTVVRRDQVGLSVLATGGLDDLGGLDVDAALVGHVGQLLALHDPDAWRRLAAPDTTAEQRDRRAFWSEVRSAKEMLSRASSAPVQVPGREEALHLTREELNRVAGPLIDRAVDETRRVLQRAGVGPGALAGIFLVGGSSRIPLVASRLHARFGVAPMVPEQPELPVAHGGLLCADTTDAQMAANPLQGGLRAVPGAPIVGGLAENPATGSAPTGLPDRPATGLVPAPPAGQVSAPRSGGQPLPPPGHGATPEPVTPGPPTRRGSLWKSPFRLLLPIGLVIVIAAGFVPVRNLLAGPGKADAGTYGPGGQAVSGKLTETQNIALVNAGGAAVTVSGDTAYYASVKPGGTDVVALPTKGGAELWKQTVKVADADTTIKVVGGIVLVGGSGTRAGLNAPDGTVLWDSKPWPGRRDLAYIGTDVLVESTGGPGPAVSRVDLGTGTDRWSRPLPGGGQPSTNARFAYVDRTWGAGAEGVTAGYTEFVESLGAQADTVLLDGAKGTGHVIDAAGKDKVVQPLPLDPEHWTVFNGMVVGVRKNTDTIVAYQMANLSKVWEHQFPSGTTFGPVSPCGPTAVCVGVQNAGRSGSTITAFGTADGAQGWAREGGRIGMSAMGCLVLGGTLVCGARTYGYIDNGVVLDPAKGDSQGWVLRDAAVRAASAQRLVIQSYGNSRWAVSVGDLGRNRVTKPVEIGTEQLVSASIFGDTVAVVDGARHVRVLRISP
ncbi:Hsp70 family protein [Longispora urticae]